MGASGTPGFLPSSLLTMVGGGGTTASSSNTTDFSFCGFLESGVVGFSGAFGLTGLLFGSGISENDQSVWF